MSGLFRHSEDAIPTTIVTLGAAVGVAACVLRLGTPAFAFLAAVSIAMRCIGPAHQHCHAHLSVFRASPLNALYDQVLALGTGNCSAVWELQHARGHHRQFLDPRTDVAGVRRFSFSDAWSTLARRLVYMLAADVLTIPDSFGVAHASGKYRSRLLGRLCLHLALQAAALVVLWRVNPAATAIVFLVPNVALRWLVTWASFGQHEGAPTTHVYDASNTRFGAVSRVLFNVGHHTAHHEKPTLHWSLLPERTARIQHLIPPVCLHGTPDPSAAAGKSGGVLASHSLTGETS